MPTVKFEVLVTVGDGSLDKQTAIAQAASYLAYADQTDTVGYHGSINHVGAQRVVEDDGPTWVMSLNIEAIASSPEDIARFERELDTLARVSDWTCFSHHKV